jgi:hypothetical protein
VVECSQEVPQAANRVVGRVWYRVHRTSCDVGAELWTWESVSYVRPAGKNEVGIVSIVGRIAFTTVPPSPQTRSQIRYFSQSTDRAEFYFLQPSILGFGFNQTFGVNTVSVPVWFPLVLAAISATLPWVHKLRWHFSLRTLLIITTVAAVLLGAIVYSFK